MKNISYIVPALFCASFCSGMVNAEEQKNNDSSTIASPQAFLSALSQNDGYEWLRRTDFSFTLSDDNKPEFSVETIQPLFQDENDTYFIQGRVSHKDDDETYNIGTGYRYLLDNKEWMFGGNAFYDMTAEEEHKRYGLGGEIFNPYATLRANYYNAFSGTKVTYADSDVIETEKALDGYDLSIETPVPYAPWATMNLTGYKWEGDRLDDLYGYDFTLKAQVNAYLEASLALDHNEDDDTALLTFTWRVGKPESVEYTAVDDGFTAVPITKRDLAKHQLEKVKRHNDIVVEKITTSTSTGGIIVGRHDQ